ncbi:MAG: SGNH/GDSL hydrolase family protein [Isosphaeraceae bacterium]
MPHLSWQGRWSVWLAAGVLSWLWMRRHDGRQLAMLAILVNLLYACSCQLLMPGAEPIESAIAALGLLAIDLAVWFAPESLQQATLRLVRWHAVKIMLTVAAASLVPLGLAELSCRILTGLGVLKYHQAIQTVWRSGHDDWRLATITGDENREPDPVLLWRPVARKPYSAQRFKGPLIQVPKPPDVVRVMCYGDSLTDGPPKGGWVTWLRTMFEKQSPLAGRSVEVVNAGVAGYSSHQGVLRFLQEVDRYQPDLVLVSYGWNDAAEAIGQPDRSFQPPPWPVVVCQRALIRYRAYLVLMYYTRSLRPAPPVAPAGSAHPRVSVEDYLANLERFRSAAEARGIPIVFLTRPHKLAPAALRQDPTWRGSVPAYNTALSAWAAGRGLPLIDAQQSFEQLPSSLFSDECHFTPEGNRQMAEMIRGRLLEGPQGILRLAASRQKPGSNGSHDRPTGPIHRVSDRTTGAVRR